MRMHLALATIVLAAAPALGQRLLLETFDTAPGWTLEGVWQIGAATLGGGSCTGGLGNPDPDIGANGGVGNGIAGTNIGGDIPNFPGLSRYLTSPVVNAGSPSGTLIVSYSRWLNVGALVNARVQVFDGANWVTVDTYTDHYDSTWQRVDLDVTPYANAAFQVRFGYQTMSGYPANCSGFSVDNVLIRRGAGLFERFDDNSNGWTLQPSWEIGGAIGANNEPQSDGDRNFGSGVAGNVIGDFANNASIRYLVSPAVNALALQSPQLTIDRFVRAASGEATLDVWDGTAWQNLWTNGSSLFQNSFSQETFNLGPYKNGALRVRFGYIGTFGGWTLDNVSIHDTTPNPGGQASSAAASLDVNGTAHAFSTYAPVSANAPGPYSAAINSGTLTLQFAGAPSRAIILLSGPLNTGANPIGTFGVLDIGSPGFGSLFILGSGLDGTFLSYFFTLNPAGTQQLSLQVPAIMVGTTTSLQAILTHPTLGYAVTNAVQISVI